MVEKEARVVESEFRKNYNSLVRKLNQVKRSLSNQESSYNKFGTGNFTTYFPYTHEFRSKEPQDLESEIQSKIDRENNQMTQYLQHFFDTWYKPENMNIVVYDNKPLDELENLVSDILTQNVKSGNSNSLEVEETILEDILNGCGTIMQPYRGSYIGRFIKMVPPKSSNFLTLKFYFEGKKEFRTHKLLGYFSHLIGHEGEGSLLSFLVEQNFAMGLTTSSYMLERHFSSLSIKVMLTTHGLDNIDRVVESIGEYVQMIKT